MDLKECRQKINEIDLKMANLFEERMEVIGHIIEYKIDNNLPILDSNREKEVIEKNTNYIRNNNLKKYYQEFITSTMKISKEYQKEIKENKQK